MNILRKKNIHAFYIFFWFTINEPKTRLWLLIQQDYRSVIHIQITVL